MRIFARLKSWLRPDPADALKGAEGEKLLPDEAGPGPSSLLGRLFPWWLHFWLPVGVGDDLSPTPQHPNNQSLADPLGSEIATGCGGFQAGEVEACQFCPRPQAQEGVTCASSPA